MNANANATPATATPELYNAPVIVSDWEFNIVAKGAGKDGKGKRQFKEQKELPIVTLAYFGIDTPYTLKTEHNEDTGVTKTTPQYEDEIYQWLQDTIIQRLGNIASQLWKKGEEADTDIKSMLERQANATRGTGTYFADLKEYKQAIFAFLTDTMGIAETTAGVLVDKLDVKVLESATDKLREKLTIICTKFAETEPAANIANINNKMLTAMEETEELSDEMLDALDI